MAIKIIRWMINRRIIMRGHVRGLTDLSGPNMLSKRDKFHLNSGHTSQTIV